MPAAAFSIDTLLRQRIDSSPEQAVFHYRSRPDGTWVPVSWSQLGGLVADCRTWLRGIGLGRGSVLGLLLPTSVTWEVVHLACLAEGITVVGLDHHDLGDNLRHAVEASGAATVLTDPATAAKPAVAGLAPIQLLLTVNLDDEQAPVSQRADARRSIPGKQSAVPGDDADPLATIVFTSGSTGKPKGIAYSYAQLTLAVDDILEAFPEIRSGQRTACWLPLSNLFQRIVNLCALRAGAEVYLVEDPRRIMDLLPEIRPSVLIGVPRFFEKVFENVRTRLGHAPRPVAGLLLGAMARSGPKGVLPRVSRALVRAMTGPVRAAFGGRILFLISGSAPMPAWLLRNYDAMGLPVLEAYGLSENIVPVAANRLSARRYGSVGRPLRSNELKMAPDGELLVRGPGVCRRYCSGEDELARDADGYLATGDYAEIDAEGFVWLRGRKSEIFKTSTGRRISPVEIEQQVLQSGVVDHAVVFGAGRKFLLLLVTLAGTPAQGEDAESRVSEAMERIGAALEGLPEYKRPAGAVCSTQPLSPLTGELTANLKLRRKVIEARHAASLDALYAALQSAQPGPPRVLGRDGTNYLVAL